MKNKLFLILLFSGVYSLAFAQVKGPDRIVGTYTGEQKKELAQGKGKSVGKDTYEGEFKKGFPVTGVYVFGEDIDLFGFKYAKGDSYTGEFSNGFFDGKGKLTFQEKTKPAIEGYWEKGKFAGRTKNGYEIIKKTNISRIVVKKNGAAPNEISVLGLTDLVEVGTRNIEFNSTDSVKTYLDLPDSKFPFTVNVRGTAPNNAKSEFQVLIENPGFWVIKVYTN